MTPPDPKAVADALARYKREAYKEGHFGDPAYRNVGYLTGEDGWEDRAMLANAYVARESARVEVPADVLESAKNVQAAFPAVGNNELKRDAVRVSAFVLQLAGQGVADGR